ncbi:hypothetical protein WJX84_009268 [Apatococcus fuscideae]|uniref:HIT-type domain-containing protein n=1 Tax=Apatococcus fuscideae TaxID=2026836 RepID=A0AAW1T1F0_9CHLO
MSGGKSASRRSGRDKKTAQKVAVVGKAERQQAATARLDRLEDDQDAAEILGQQSDDEFRLEDSDEGPQPGEGRKRKKGAKRPGAKRKTRGQLAEQRGPKSFATMLDEADLEDAPEDAQNYLTAAAAPSVYPAHRWCSVCGFAAPYKCVRCGSQCCSRKCFGVHSETRCLKFTM